MRCNFRIISFRDVEIEGRLIDLHNNFHFMGFAYDVSLGTFVINFRKGTGTWIQKDEPETVQFFHSEISLLNIQKVGENEYPEDAKTLSEITFYPSSERNENDNFMERSSPEPGDDLLYSFLQGSLIRINCEEVTLLVSP
jgi:hypothetical protein